MKWTVADSTRNWLKIRGANGRAYFILWEQDPAFLAIDLLPVIPFDPAESTKLTVSLAAGDLPHLKTDEIATSIIRDRDLVKLWRAERRKHERARDLEPLRVKRKRERKKRPQ